MRPMLTVTSGARCSSGLGGGWSLGSRTGSTSRRCRPGSALATGGCAGCATFSATSAPRASDAGSAPGAWAPAVGDGAGTGSGRGGSRRLVRRTGWTPRSGVRTGRDGGSGVVPGFAARGGRESGSGSAGPSGAGASTGGPEAWGTRRSSAAGGGRGPAAGGAGAGRSGTAAARSVPRGTVAPGTNRSRRPPTAWPGTAYSSTSGGAVELSNIDGDRGRRPPIGPTVRIARRARWRVMARPRTGRGAAGTG